jgi:hypothetical protein
VDASLRLSLSLWSFLYDAHYFDEDLAAMGFHVPEKKILSPEQLVAFQASKTHTEIMVYIQDLNDAVVGVKLSDPCAASEVSLSTGRLCMNSYSV